MVINTDTRSYLSYRIGPGTYVPLMFDPTGGGAWCAALCDTHAEGDPTSERAVSDPIGREGVVALPSVCDGRNGLGISPSPTFALRSYYRTFCYSLYRIDHGTNEPMGLTLLTEDVQMCALCATPFQQPCAEAVI